MTLNIKVSLGGESTLGKRDVSARATHLKAVFGKVSLTTIERKIMSTKTTFKRIALVAVASMGFGMLNAVPSNATVLDNSMTLTVANGSATYGKSDSTTAATVTVGFTGDAGDTAVVSFISVSKPADSTGFPYLAFSNGNNTDTAAATYSNSDTTGSTGAVTPRTFSQKINKATTTYAAHETATVTGVASTVSKVAFKVYMDSVSGNRVAGTYTYKAVVNFYSASAALKSIQTADFSFTVAALTSNSLVASASTSSAYISDVGGGTSDSVVLAEATSSALPGAIIEVKLRNASSNTTARESVTVTTNVGIVGTPNGTFGRSVVIPYSSSDSLTVYVRPDGTAGTATISVSTPSVTFANKTVQFYAAAPSTLVASLLNSSIGAGSTSAVVGVIAKDANGLPWAGTLYSYSSDAAVFSNDGTTTCSYNTTNSRHECSVTAVSAGTATITLRDAATVATSTKSSNAVSVTSNLSAPATVSLAWDKATYAPGEKATLVVKVLDSAGKSVRAQTLANLFATGGISLNIAGGSGSETLTAVSITTASLSSAGLGTETTPIKTYTVYMPYSGGTVTASATGGASLPQAGQVAVSASAKVTDNAAEAIAAVTALASQVSAFITKINAQITTLTDLVMKIQKKVKA